MRKYKIHYKTGRVDYQGVWLLPQYVRIFNLENKIYYT